ncbi:MAG: diguanylate cyclase [Lachnospiraceae bacterium]|nr:diguanylate cyclase [Lachnospiraceae bacterium]
MGTYGYISIIAMVCYGFMLLMFLAAKRNKIVNSFLVVLTGLLLWTGGSAFMRAQLWPRYEFWYQVSLLGILLLPYAYYRFILAFGGGREGIAGKSYIVAMLVCFVVNIRHGLFLACPDLVKKNGLPTFVYEIKPTILVLFFLVGVFLVHLFMELLRICRTNPNMKVQYEPVMIGVVVLFAGNVLIGLPVFSGFPVDILSGVVNVFLLFYALIRRRLFRLQMLASSSLCYGVGFLFSVIVFFNVIPYLQKMLHLQMDANMTLYALVFAVAFLVIYALFTFLWKLLVRNVFVKDEIHQAEKIKEFSSAISKTLDLQKIMDETIHVVKELMEVGNIYICMQDAPGEPYRGLTSDQPLNDLAFTLEEENPMIQWLAEHEEPLIYREFRYTVEYKSMWEREKHQLDKKRIRYCAGLKDGECLAGVLLITAPSSKKGLVYDEVQLLSSITSVASIAIKNARLYEKACIEARTDEMTGLLNRKYFYEVLNEEFEKNKEASLALAIINVDDFKLYNQLYGIKEGDICLQRIADIIRSSVGDSGYTARYGGKEFAVLLPKYDLFSAKNLVESIAKQIFVMNNRRKDMKLKAVTVSAGISAAPYAAKNVKELMENVDLAVYHVKHSGKNGIQVFDTMFKSSNERGNTRDRAHIYQEYESTIYALTAAIDVKDHYTFSHSNNVAYYATALAAALGMNEDIVEIIRQAALLHDVGKIGIPEYVLNKPGKLTEEEYEIIKGHVEASIDIIRHLPSLDYVIPAVIGHHERYDGTGYPRRIAGEDIPVTARILCIADCFDAMTSRRCYKKAFPVEVAREKLLQGAGRQFDPDMVYRFVECLDDGSITLVESEDLQENIK